MLKSNKVYGFIFCLGIFIDYGLLTMDCFAEDFVYNSKGKRDPFVPLAGAGAVYQVKEAADINSIEDVVLEGILYDSKGGSIAIINGIILKEGDQAGIITIDKIEPKKVILRIEDNAHELFLGKEKGGEGE